MHTLASSTRYQGVEAIGGFTCDKRGLGRSAALRDKKAAGARDVLFMCECAREKERKSTKACRSKVKIAGKVFMYYGKEAIKGER
jgi:hypothetical protein